MQKLAAFIAVFVLSTSLVYAQTVPATGRKVAARITPAYPELAKKMHIQGVVKIEAIVRPNGVVKSARVLGGNPVLVEAASDAVKKWKFEAASTETTEVVQLAFEDQ